MRFLPLNTKDFILQCFEFLGTPYVSASRVNRPRLKQFIQAHSAVPPVDRVLQGGIAIIVPCYNHAEYLEATLTSIARQTYRPFDAVFVEDHSTDDSFTQLKRLVPQLPSGIQTTLLQTPKNSGQAFALNMGIENTRASLVMILNDDDYLKHDAVEGTIQILESNADMFLFGTTAVPFSGKGCPAQDEKQLLIRSHWPAYRDIPLKRYSPTFASGLSRPNDINMTHSGSTFFKTAWRVVGGYYPQKSQRVVAFSDRDFQIRLMSLFTAGASMAVPFVYWRQNSSVDAGRYT